MGSHALRRMHHHHKSRTTTSRLTFRLRSLIKTLKTLCSHLVPKKCCSSCLKRRELRRNCLRVKSQSLRNVRQRIKPKSKQQTFLRRKSRSSNEPKSKQRLLLRKSCSSKTKIRTALSLSKKSKRR